MHAVRRRLHGPQRHVPDVLDVRPQHRLRLTRIGSVQRDAEPATPRRPGSGAERTRPATKPTKTSRALPDGTPATEGALMPLRALERLLEEQEERDRRNGVAYDE